MSAEQAQRTMDRYFDLMGRREDFAECYAAEVTWLIADTGEVVRGPHHVRDYVIALHAAMVDAHTRRFVVGERNVYLEGDCAAVVPSGDGRIRYCIAYDMEDDLIAAVRCYGLGDRSAL